MEPTVEFIHANNVVKDTPIQPFINIHWSLTYSGVYLELETSIFDTKTNIFTFIVYIFMYLYLLGLISIKNYVIL